MHDAYRLGASLYVPAIHPKLKDALRGAIYGRTRSLIACTEDSIADTDVERALAHLSRILPLLPQRDQGPLRFIRPRNACVLAEILRMEGIERVHGFVIPKADVDTLGPYEAALGRHDYWLMPTLETAAVFDPLALRELRQRLTAGAIQRHILALRIGGNDLLKMLGLRRLRGVSIYQTPLGLLIPQLVLAFRAFGLHLTAPVFDFIDDPDTLTQEVRQDVQMGLIGKTAIHPDQVPVIEAGLAVTEHELELARQILAPRREAVFRLHGAMIEKAVHTEWAYAVLARAVVQVWPRIGASPSSSSHHCMHPLVAPMQPNAAIPDANQDQGLAFPTDCRRFAAADISASSAIQTCGSVSGES